MFRKGDTIVYATTGVCVIDDIREQACTGEVQTYYVLQPVFDSSSKVFAPVGASEQKMRAVLTAGEADELVRALPDAPADWIDNDTRRKETFSAMLRSGDRGELVRLVKTLHLHRLELQQCGRKFHLADERMLRDAERVLFEELAYALSIPPESVGDYLRTHAQTTAVG